DPRHGGQPDGRGELRQGDPPLHREESAALRAHRPSRPTRRARHRLDARTHCRHGACHRDRRALRWFVLVRHRLGRRDALGLPRGRAHLMARVAVTVPPSARRGEIIEIKTLAQHEMETGFRRTRTGEPVPRDIITGFVCRYNGVEVFRAELHQAVAANPLIAFTTVATESGTFEFTWTGDNGYLANQKAEIKVV